MALSRKMLQAMDIPAEKIDEIINAHSETVNAIKAERDELKPKADKLDSVEKALKDTQAELEKIKAGDWETKYNTVKSEYDSFKADTETKAIKTAKETAYKQLLLDSGISEKRVASILKVTSMDNVELDGDGKIKDAEKFAESIKSEWADFITTPGQKGADVPTPPKGDDKGTKQPSVAKQLAEAFQREHYGTLTETKKED
jgi:hypothetical protein